MSRANLDAASRDELGSGMISRAFVVSLLLHFALVAGVELGRASGWWRHSLLSKPGEPSLIRQVIEEAARRAEQQQVPTVPEAELIFVDADPAQAVEEPPENTKYYSAVSTRAANLDTRNLEVPKIDGRQERVPKTADTMRPDPRALQPAPPAVPVREVAAANQQAPPNQNQARPAEEERPMEQTPGDMLLARTAPRPQPAVEPAPPQAQPLPRPRTLAEARARQGIIEAPRMRQDGGVRRHALDPGLDVKATPFGAYDALFVAAVQARWFNLLDERDYVGNQSGRVVVEFHLRRDGRITELRVVESQVNETLAWLCQRAILDPAPYRPFPPDLVRLLHRDYRPVRFTFYYNQ